ncbi:ASPIC/UnbV domain-containing protein, partial [Akkermansiaceae bacterium]|nr:ASPIC/UnbV domain-containing protein [Akkermansiaceae bacterium]
MSQIPTKHEDIPNMARPDSAYRRHLKRLNELISDGASLSGHERNCAFLNVDGGKFATVSSVSGLDFDDDARSPVSIDWDRDGDLDLWVANRTAPQLRFLRNDTPADNHFVALRLRGTTSNRDGIGARVEVLPSGSEAIPPLIKTLKAGEGFLGQSSKWLHFGLGKNPALDRVIVRWPGGAAEEFTDITADGHFLLQEGLGKASPVERAPISLPENPKVAPLSSHQNASRIVTPTRAGLPPLRYANSEGKSVEISLGNGRPTLVNLWASWCAPCSHELAEWHARQIELKAAGVHVVAISVDQLESKDDSSADAALRTIREIAPSLEFGFAT